MQNFILVSDDGSTYKCEPQKVKQLSQAEVTKFTTNSSVTGKIEKSEVVIHDSRFNGLVHFAAALPNEPMIKKLPIYTVMENGKKVIFSKLTQMFFSGEFAKTAADPEGVTLRGYAQSGSRDVLYNCTLPWSTQALASKIGVKVYFIPFAVFNSKDGFIDNGCDLSRVSFSDPTIPNGLATLFSHYSYPEGNPASLYLAMGIEGSSEAYFPLISNVFEDLKVCLGRYYPHEVHSTPSTDQEMFIFMLVSFLFSQFNADLLGVSGQGQSRFEKTKLIEKLFCWNKDTLKYSPSITKEEINGFAKDHPTRKFALDIAKRSLDAIGH